MKDFHGKGRKIQTALRPLLYGCLTGIVCGAVLSLFLVCSKIVLAFSFDTYYHASGALTIVCILILAIMCCLLTAVIQKLCATAKGSGIPLAEAEARGMLRVKWLNNAASLIVGSLLAFVCGMPLGSEGPCVGVGALVGDGIGRLTKQKDGFRRYMITGGACAGLATAFNAPLTGLCFAFEEAHRRFSPYILISALSAVITAVATSQTIFWGLGHVPYLSSVGVRAGGVALAFLIQTPILISDMPAVMGVSALCGIVCAVLGVTFTRLIGMFNKLFGKIQSNALRLLPAFLLAAVCGLLVPLSVGSGEQTLEHGFMGASALLIVALLIIRFIITAAASGSGATGGLFIPMIAIGGLLGVLAAKAATACGLNEAYAPNIVIICVCAFFAATVRAPITAVAMSFELTASFANLLPCLTAIVIASVIAELTKTDPLYEQMLENLQASVPPSKNAANMTVRGIVGENSPVVKRRVRNIFWPYNTLVTALERDGKQYVPDGETKLRVGDIITMSAELVDPEEYISMLAEYVDVINPTETENER